MSAVKEILLPALAAAAGYGDNVGAYMAELDRRNKLDREYEEHEFWKSVHDGTYFEADYEEVEK